jgi:cell division protein ZapA (FtsZ GTPase activity inhibitor)
MEAKSLKLRIFDKEYTIVSDESEERVKQTAYLVDSLMREIVEHAKKLPEERIAVLAALRLASQLLAIESKEKQAAAKAESLNALLDRELAASSQQ